MMHGNNKGRDDFSGITSKFDQIQIDTSKTLYQMNIECILFSNTYQMFINDDDVLVPKSFKKFQIINNIQSIL